MPVTLKEIAAEAGVSIYTVSRVLNGKTKEAYAPAVQRAKHIRQVAQRLGFIPNSAARAMQSNKTKIVGVLIRHESPLGSLIDYETVLGINTGLEAAGYVLALTRSSDLPLSSNTAGAAADPNQPANPQSRLFRERMVDGIVVLGPVSPSMCELAERVAPVVLWMDSNIQRDHNCIRRDEYQAGRLAAMKMIEAGYRKLVYVNSHIATESRHYSFTDRLRGVRDVADEHHHPLTIIDVHPPAYCEVGQKLPSLVDPDTAVIVPNDRHALAVQAQLPPMGKTPGIHFGMAACDCVHSVRVAWPELTCVDVDRYGLGMQAATMMIQMLTNPTAKCESRVVRWGWHEGTTAPRRN